MRFGETSAVVPLLLEEVTTDAVARELEADPEQTVWCATRVGCASALAKLERDGGLDAGGVAEATAALVTLAESWDEVQPSERVRQAATRLLRVHDLRFLDAFQLAAALVACDGDPGSLPFVVLDRRLSRAADREGFPVVTPSTRVG